MPNKLNLNNQQGGFTLIETFGAITILILAVLGPLSLLSANIADGAIIKNQMTANYLAQEGVELVVRERNLRLKDENVTSANWLGAFQNCTEANPCNMDPVSFTKINCNSGNNDCQVYAATEAVPIAGGEDVVQWSQFFATDDASRQGTIFNRLIYMVPESDDYIYSDVVVPIDPEIPEVGSQTYFSGPERVKVVVTVGWNFKGLDKSYSLSTYLYNFAAIRAVEVAP